MAIMPYPVRLERELVLRDGSSCRLRAIRPEDAQSLQQFVRSMSQETRYFRFVASIKELSPRQLARYTQIDYWRDMALIAEIAVPAAGETGAAPPESSDAEPLPRRFAGVARYMLNADMHSCEFAIAIADDWQGRGLGRLLMQSLIEVAQSRQLTTMNGMILAQNHKMAKLMQRLGFVLRQDPEDGSMLLASKEL
jgi:acetyltransferase